MSLDGRVGPCHSLCLQGQPLRTLRTDDDQGPCQATGEEARGTKPTRGRKHSSGSHCDFRVTFSLQQNQACSGTALYTTTGLLNSDLLNGA